MPCQTSQTRQQRRWQQQCPSGGGAAGGSGAGAGRSLPARALATAAAGASAGAGANAELDDAALERIEELVDSELWAAGVEAEFDPAGRRDLVAAAVALHAAGAGARWATAAVLGAPWGSVTADLGAALADKVSRYLRWASQEPGAADDLVQALVHGDCLLEVAALPPEAFEANLQFVAAQVRWCMRDGSACVLLACPQPPRPLASPHPATRSTPTTPPTCSQLPRLGRRQYQALNEPYSLARWVQLNPETAGAVLLAGAASFGDTAVPWLREQLGWGEGEIAGAALSGHLPALCALPTPHAQRCLAWLCAGAGLTQLQAGQLLAADVALLAGGDADLASRQGWAERELLSPADGVGSAALAAALCLAQPPQHRSGGVAQRTRRLAALLQVRAGMLALAARRINLH